MQNWICEAFNGRMGDELLNETLFDDLDHARSTLARWTAAYNQKRRKSPGSVSAFFAATPPAATRRKRDFGLALLALEGGEPLGKGVMPLVEGVAPALLVLDGRLEIAAELGDRLLGELELGSVVRELPVYLLRDDVEEIVADQRNFELASLPRLLVRFLVMPVDAAFRLAQGLADSLEQRPSVFVTQLGDRPLDRDPSLEWPLS